MHLHSIVTVFQYISCQIRKGFKLWYRLFMHFLNICNGILICIIYTHTHMCIHICVHMYICIKRSCCKRCVKKVGLKMLYRFLSLGPTVHCDSQEEQHQEWCTHLWSSSSAFLFFSFLFLSFFCSEYEVFVSGRCYMKRATWHFSSYTRSWRMWAVFFLM